MDDGLLIEQVSLFPVLYDKKDARYKSKISKEAAWKTIGSILHEHPLKCEQRWLVLRNKYVKLQREIRSIPSGSGSEAIHIDWPYFENMGFLNPFLTTRRTKSNITRPSQAWNTFSQMTDVDSDDFSSTPTRATSPLVLTIPEAQPEIEPQPETEQLTPSITLRPNLAKGKTILGRTAAIKRSAQEAPESELLSPTITPRPNLAKGKTILGRTPAIKRSAQEAMVDKLSSCFDSISKKMSMNTDSSDINFAIGLSKDMEILTAEEKIKFKKMIYDDLNKVLAERYEAI